MGACEDEELCTVEEVAKTLRISVMTIRRFCEAGEFEGALKVGRQWRIPRQSLDTYIARQREAAGR